MVCRRHGGPEVLEPADLDDPALGPRDFLTDVAAAGVNFADLLMVWASYPGVTLPLVPGLEVAGTVRSVGGAVFDAAFDCLVPGGHLVAYGVASGAFASVPVQRLLGCGVGGFRMGHVMEAGR